MNTRTIMVAHGPGAGGPGEPPFAKVRDELLGALAQGAAAVTLGGGEPLRRSDLLALVRIARANGARAVTVETGGEALSPAVVAALKEAGVSAVRVSFSSARPLPGSPTPDPQRVLQGLANCLRGQLEVVVRLRLDAGLPAPAGRLQALASALPGLRRFELHLGPTPSALSAFEVGAQLEEAWSAAQRLELELALAPQTPLPPCQVELSPGARRLLAGQLREPELPNRAVQACARCALSRRCRLEVAELERFGGGEAVCPVADEAAYLRPGRSAGARLRTPTAEQVEGFFHVDYEYGADVGTPTSRVGVVYRCNQTCSFCELADMDVELPREKVREAIARSHARGSRRLILTGGEPTLSRELAGYVAQARELGFEQLELQTNAVLLDRPGAAQALREAGLTDAQVSLHGPDAAISDRLTAAPGTHARTLNGVTRLLEAGVRVRLNHLVFKDNCHLLEQFVELVEQRWSAFREKLVLQFHSARNEFATREEALAHVARYSEYAPALCRAIDRARALGFSVHDLGDPTGIPSLCVVGADERFLGPVEDQAVRPRFHAWESEWMTRVEACQTCELAAACMGVPRHYLELHGDAEFRALRRGSPRARS